MPYYGLTLLGLVLLTNTSFSLYIIISQLIKHFVCQYLYKFLESIKAVENKAQHCEEQTES